MAVRGLVFLALAGFVGLGLGEGSTGVAWPSIASDFERPVGELGIVITALVVGYLVASAASGHVSSRVGIGRSLALSSTLSAVALGSIAIAQAWWAVLAAMAALGLGTGLIDAGLNTHASLAGRARHMHLLHAAFGLGATLGPVVVTVSLGVGGGWRLAYAGFAVLHAGLAWSYWSTRASWVADVEVPDPSRARPGRAVFVSLSAFLLYTGVEVAAGQWAYSVLTGDRGIGEAIAGMLVGGYWASLTVGRLVVGGVGDRVSPDATLVVGALAAASGSTLFWWAPTPVVGAAGLWLVGLGLAPIFPALVLLTPRRVGRRRSEAVVGYQLAAAGVGAALVPGAIGLLVEVAGLGAVAPAVFVAAMAMGGMVEVARRSEVPVG